MDRKRPSLGGVTRATVDGLTLGYEIIGERGRPWIITPGGRYPKEDPGIRPLAEALAAAGNRVVIWDRPNCGESDVCFDGPTESEMQADYLAGVWAHYGKTKFKLNEADLESALNAAYKIGDDWLQRKARGYVVPGNFTHGKS